MPPTFPSYPPPPAGRHVRGLCFYCCLLGRFTRFSAKRRIPCQPPPHVTERGGKATFLLIFVHKLFVASSSPSSPHRPPPLSMQRVVYLKEISLFVVAAAALRFDVFIHTVFRALSFPAQRSAVALPISPQPRCCQFKCFRNYEHLKKMFISQAKYIFVQVHMVDFDLKRFSDSDLKITTS